MMHSVVRVTEAYVWPTCRSVRASEAAISIRRGRQRYLLKWNSFSSSKSCQQTDKSQCNWLTIRHNTLHPYIACKQTVSPWIKAKDCVRYRKIQHCV